MSDLIECRNCGQTHEERPENNLCVSCFKFLPGGRHPKANTQGRPTKVAIQQRVLGEFLKERGLELTDVAQDPKLAQQLALETMLATGDIRGAAEVATEMREYTEGKLSRNENTNIDATPITLGINLPSKPGVQASGNKKTRH